MNQQRVFDLAVPVEAADHVIGASHAPVTIVEYGDFECPNCKQAAPALKLLLERFAGKVHAVFRHFPLEELHPHALAAAHAAWVSPTFIRVNRPSLSCPPATMISSWTR